MHSEKFYNRLVSMQTASKDLLFSHSMARADEAVLENLCLSAFNAHSPYHWINILTRSFFPWTPPMPIAFPKNTSVIDRNHRICINRV